MATDLVESMRSCMPAKDAPEEAYPPAFDSLAELLLDRAVLHIAAIPHRLTEIEFYYNGRGHTDKFAHGDPVQRRFGVWYFHRTGGEYRGGTYKGVDIAFGTEDAPAGILVRGIERIDTATLVDGPCLVVDHLLALNGAPSIQALVSRFDIGLQAPGGDPAKSPLCMTLRPDRLGKTIYHSPRVGLTLKRADTVDRRRFVGRDYRALTEPALIKKGKPHLAVALHRKGVSHAEIARITGTKPSVIARYAEAYDAGRAQDAALFREAANPNEICSLFGACDGPKAP